MRKLVAAMENGQPQVREPLLIYACLSGKTDYLLTLVDGKKVADEYADVLAGMKGQDVEGYLASTAAPKRYAQVFDAYKGQWDHLNAQRRIKALIRPKIVEKLRESGSSTYEMCQELGANKGNAYAYLRGNVDAVSYNLARQFQTWSEEQCTCLRNT